MAHARRHHHMPHCCLSRKRLVHFHQPIPGNEPTPLHTGGLCAHYSVELVRICPLGIAAAHVRRIVGDASSQTNDAIRRVMMVVVVLLPQIVEELNGASSGALLDALRACHGGVERSCRAAGVCQGGFLTASLASRPRSTTGFLAGINLGLTLALGIAIS